MDIKTKDNITISENLTNHKRWFNGMKKFSSVKVEPHQENPPDLGIHVEDTIDTSEKIS